MSAARHQTQGLSLVVATEVACQDVETQTDCFDAQTGLTWLLLTSIPIETTDAIQRIIRV